MSQNGSMLAGVSVDLETNAGWVTVLQIAIYDDAAQL
jgi:hypothetical protein